MSKILIVDDQEVNREICEIILAPLQATILTAADGAEGLRLAREHLPDLILLDIMMPVLDGYAMLEQLRSQPELTRLPVLMLTARSDTDSVVKALTMGANDYLRKPFEDEEMLARAHNLLHARLLEKRLEEDLAAGAAMQHKYLTNGADLSKNCYEAGYLAWVRTRPYTTVSGDFFHVRRRDDGSCVLVLADTCGHGLSAALLSMRIIGFLAAMRSLPASPEEYLQQLNQDIHGVLPRGSFVAASCLLLQPDGFFLANAAQPYPILLVDGNCEELVLDGPALGQFAGASFGSHHRTISDGGRLLLHTDGLLEIMDPQESCYGKQRLDACLKKNRALSGDQLLDALLEDVDAFRQEREADDDITLILLEKEG
ncbi:MAG: hypothetical protein BWK76_04955 [Desulfobulbaceae bacterium A2]|nr:MAG: hypothetical protein BWK76_04955 [Desulfobulbaceae bacterium A2]